MASSPLAPRTVPTASSTALRRSATGSDERSGVTRRAYLSASVVVGLPGQDLVGPIDLLEQDDPSQLVGQGQPGQAEAMIEVFELQAERSAHHEAQIAATLPALLQK